MNKVFKFLLLIVTSFSITSCGLSDDLTGPEEDTSNSGFDLGDLGSGTTDDTTPASNNTPSTGGESGSEPGQEEEDNEGAEDCLIYVESGEIVPVADLLSKGYITIDGNGSLRIGAELKSKSFGLFDLVLKNTQISSVVDMGYCNNIRSISFFGNTGLKSINNKAFIWSSNLTEIILPEGLEFIGEFAFCRTSIIDMVLPSTVNSLSKNAFDGCTKLESISFSPSLDKIDSLGTNITNLKNIVIPQGVKRIEEKVFEKTNIENVILPNTLIFLGAYAFANCSNLESVTLHKPSEGTIEFNMFIFSNCTKLKTIIWNGTIEEYKQNYYWDGYGIYPSGVTIQCSDGSFNP